MPHIPREEFLAKLPRAAHGCMVLLLDASSRVLMLKKAPNPDHAFGIWQYAGGLLDEGERPDEAAMRETLEETGLVLPRVTPLGVEFRPPSAKWPLAVTNYFFTAPLIPHSQADKLQLSDEHAEYQWLPVDRWDGVADEERVALTRDLLVARSVRQPIVRIHHLPEPEDR